jgi:hypothetical protein
MTEKLILAALIAGAAIYTARVIFRAVRAKDGQGPCAHCANDCADRSKGRRGDCP